MGWLIGWRTKDELVKHLVDNEDNSVDVLDHSVVGNHLWMLCRVRPRQDGTVELGRDGQPLVFIALCLLAGGPRGTGPSGRDWGYKGMDESAGPCAYDCPVKFLDASTLDHKYATPWREQCRQWRADRAARLKWIASLRKGDTFYLDDRPMKYIPSGHGYHCSSQFVIGETDVGDVFRFPKNRITAQPRT